MIFVGDVDFQFQNNEISCGRLLRPWLYSWLALMTIQTNFQGQANLEAHGPPISPMIMCYT